MRIAITSDTHFGDNDSQLVSIQGNKAVTGKKYDAFRKAVKEFGKCDYLILAGDILDFSIASYEKSYECAKFFFEKIRKDDLTNKVIYIAGNHDADIWHIVQHQRHVINKIAKNKKLPEVFQHSVAGILDDRSGSHESKGLTLNGVRIKDKKKDKKKKKYGGMYLDKIAEGITFYFAYPNLYIVTDNESVLVTHGHYLNNYWSFMGMIAEKIASDDLGLDYIDIEKTVELNFPLNQLACTGIGQAGVLTEKIIRSVELDVRKKDFNRIKNYLNRLVNMTENRLLKLLIKGLICIGKKFLIAELGKIESARYNKSFLKDNEDRLRKFYKASLSEIRLINAKPPFNAVGCNLPIPYKIIFGHTHLPTPWKTPDKPFSDKPSSDELKNLTFYNTSGWLSEGSTFKGAELFLYETDKGFRSVHIA